MTTTEMTRDMLFIRHANPEDNDLTRWPALQLAKDGYPAWCDLTELLGGERFWDNAEQAIRTRIRVQRPRQSTLWSKRW